ncbi:MAG: class I fructose-bisphosphate aldolase [Sphingobacteriales bacterium]|nr:MAG: class I fructose-bisphosphate aldolase [Sphingobacteriales bacterium]
MANNRLVQLLGDQAEYLLGHTCKTIDKNDITLPSADHVDKIWVNSNRSNQTLRNLQALLGHGRLANTGYCSIFPVDQGIEHSAGSAFSPNPIYFDPENIIKLAIEGGCNGVASTYGVLGLMSRKYAHKIPFVVKINHNEFLSMPNKYDQTMFGSVKNAWDMGAVGVGATIYWGSAESAKQLKEVAEAFELAHQTKHGKTSKLVYEKLTTDHPIDLTRYQVLNCYSGRIGLINSGGESKGTSDLADSVATAVVNKRAGGMGLILGRKAFQRPFKEGVEILEATQDVYLDNSITIA